MIWNNSISKSPTKRGNNLFPPCFHILTSETKGDLRSHLCQFTGLWHWKLWCKLLFLVQSGNFCALAPPPAFLSVIYHVFVVTWIFPVCVFLVFGVESSFSLLCLSSGPDFRVWERWQKSSDCSLPSAPMWSSKRRQLSQERSWGGSRNEERDSATGLCPPHGPTETLRCYKKSFLETLRDTAESKPISTGWEPRPKKW